MPKAKKSPFDAKAKQITDFFPRKSLSQASTKSSVASPDGAVQTAPPKQDTTPCLRSHTKASQGNADSSKPVLGPIFLRAGPSASSSTKVVHSGPSPIQPPAKRLRSQSIVSPQRIKRSKRSKNILCDCDYDGKMEVDDDSVVYVRSVPSTSSVPSPLPYATTLDAKESKDSEKLDFSARHFAAAAFVPSSVSEERELGPALLEEKSGIGHLQEQGLSSPETDTDSRMLLPHYVSRVIAKPTVDWDMGNGFTGTPSRPSTATSTPTPSSTDEPATVPSTLPEELLDEKARAEQIIKEIKLKALAFAQAQESACPVLEISSPITSDDDDDTAGLAPLNFRPSAKLWSPIKSKRYSLRKPFAGIASDKQRTTSDSQCNYLPSMKRKSPPANPLDVLLKERRSVSAKSGMALEDRESRLRALAYLDLNDDSEDDESSNNATTSMRMMKEDEANPFKDDQQRQQVLDILEGDRVIESEEEHIRLLGNVGAKLWDSSEMMCLREDALPPIDYTGSDPSILMLVQTIAEGDHALTHVVMDSGVLELANFTDGGENVIAFLMDLALSHRDDTLNVSACRLLSHLIRNPTVPTPILLLERILVFFRVLGAQPSILERMGWTVCGNSRGVPDGDRTSVIERLIQLIAEISRACRLSWKEVPDIVIILLLIGLEPDVSHETRLHVSHTIQQVCQFVGEDSTVEAEVENAICNKFLRLVQPFSPQNRLFSLDLLAGASGRTARVARSVAHSMLTDKPALLPSQYSALPPLAELMGMLCTVSSSSPTRLAGKFEVHDATNYVDMASWASILAVALTDIFQYVESGGANEIAATPPKSPTKEKDGCMIRALHEKLYKIHNRIQDNRAAHLDRSRTKTVLFQIAFRILYQCLAVTQNRKKSSQNIQSYFHRKQLPA